MITDWLLTILGNLVAWFVSFLPSVNLSLPALPIQWLADANYFVPIVELAGLAFLIVALGGPLAVASLTLWGIALLRGGSSRG